MDEESKTMSGENREPEIVLSADPSEFNRAIELASVIFSSDAIREAQKSLERIASVFSKTMRKRWPGSLAHWLALRHKPGRKARYTLSNQTGRGLRRRE